MTTLLEKHRESISKTGRRFLAVIRILLGALFVLAGMAKIIEGNLGMEGMLEFLNSNQESTFRFYALFLDSVVRNSPLFFAGLATIGEIALGVSLFLGAKIRLSAPVGIFMLLNFMVVKGSYPWQLGGDQILSILLAILAITNAGRTWGLDGHWLRNEEGD